MSNKGETIKGRISTTVRLREELAEKEKEYNGKIDVLGMTALTNPANISSSRNIMFTSHLSQRMNINNTEFPKVMFGQENMVGELSSGYYKADNNLEIVRIIPKYAKEGLTAHIYTVFVYDKKNDKYNIIEKKYAEELTERFGYTYNTEVLDGKRVGDKIKKGEVLYKTSGYDEEMNYGYGLNAKFCYMNDVALIEDAIVISETLAERMKSKEMETITVSLNDNDILVNLYGGSDDYKGFPNIGEDIKNNIVCAKRRIHNNQILFDVRNSNLNKINTTSDSLYYYEGTVYDINVYCNKDIDDIPDNIFNRQLKEYVEMQNTYFEAVFEMCEEIYDSGSEYSDDINHLYRKARDILDPEVKWNDNKGSVFSNMIVEISVERDTPLAEGQKITGEQKCPFTW